MDNSFEIYAIDPDQTAKGGSGVKRWDRIKPEDLKTGLDSFLEKFSYVLSECSQKIGEFNLDEIEIKVDISLTGGVRLIGAAEATTSGGLTIKFKRNKS